jgi:RHS repeat-associated protein
MRVNDGTHPRQSRTVSTVACAMLALSLMMRPVLVSAEDSPRSPVPSPAGQPIVSVAGQSMTLLPDGRWLRVGGVGEQGALGIIQVEHDGVTDTLPIALSHPRSGHTATVLPNGLVLIFGGTGADGQLVQEAELVDPIHSNVTPLTTNGLDARAQHTATLLTSGQVLFAGGHDADGNALSSAQLWDPNTLTTLSESNLQIARFAQEAALLSSGEGLVWGGQGASGQRPENGELYNPSTKLFEGPVGATDTRVQSLAQGSAQPPFISDTLPAADAVDVALDSVLAVRFSTALPIARLNSTHIVLIGPSGAVSGSVIGAERGMLAFFTPSQQLLPATTYTLFITGLIDEAGRVLPNESIRFATHRIVAPAASTSAGTVLSRSASPSIVVPSRSAVAPPSSMVGGTATPAKSPTSRRSASALVPTYQRPADSTTGEDWIPQEANLHGAWRVLGLPNDPPLTTSAAAPLSGVTHVTAISGRVLRLNGQPLPGVSLSVGNVRTTTDPQGRFLLSGVAAGANQIKIDGTSVIIDGRHYTEHFMQVNAAASITTPIPSPIYLPRVDPATEVSISSPADHEIVLTHPAIPGLEVHIPKGAVIREQDGKIVTKVSITPIPVGRAPYPTPVQFSSYFTLQPGGAYVDGDPSKAIQIIYPNYQGLPAGTTVDFWNYDPTENGWSVYGHGRVSADRKQVVPDPSVGFRQIMAFAFAEATPKQLPNPGPKLGQCSTGGDPVDCATGIFEEGFTDLAERDVMPISVNRVYRTNDNLSHAFGVGGNLFYNMWLYFAPACGQCSTAITLVQADGSQILYQPVLGVGQFPYRNIDSPSIFQGSTLAQSQNANGTEWLITLRDGTGLHFQTSNPNQLTSITDRNGNQITVTLQGDLVQQVTSPNGRYLQFFYDAGNRINQVVDNIGRSVSYTYDSSGRLATATDADGNTESYGYDPTSNGMSLVTDKRGNAKLQNVFDGNGRVTQQTLADGSVWKFSYALNSGGNITQTTITDPRGFIRQESFGPSGFLTQSIRAMGTPEQQTYLFQRDGANEVTSLTDAIGRQTAVVYDAFGDPLSLTLLYGTPNAVTYSYSYEPLYHQLTSYTDPLGHTTAIDHDGRGNILSLTDALGHATTIATSSEGLPTLLIDALGHSTQVGYRQADPASITDALNRTINLYTDAAGRLLSLTDPLGNITQYSYDPMDRFTSSTDALNEVTKLTYDQNGNLLTVHDPRGVTHTFTYDSRNRRQSYKDPLGISASYAYDGLSNLTRYTDRKGQATSIVYDGINRPTLITYQDNSTIAITWDAGNRATQFVDSLNGTITRQYDGLDRLTQEVTPQGTVSYTYDSAGRRTTMSVVGQTPVNYTFDNANRLTQIAQGALSVAYGYDDANRRTSLTYPNGVVGSFSFDGANQLTGISYANGATSIGTLVYGYDQDGRRTSVSGTLAGFTAPTNVPTITYDAANRVTSWNGLSLGYDSNGNLTSFGSNSYSWNARNQLIATSAGAATFSYDAFGRRTNSTVNGSGTPFAYDGWNLVTMGGNFMLAGPGLDDIQAMVSSGSATSFLRDGVNSTVALSSAAGSTTATFDYSPYGDTASSGSGASTLQYTGRENDGATGLYYYRNRYYSPQLGRFISQDPLGLGGGTNFYAYVGGDPVNFIDPLGLCFLGKDLAQQYLNMYGGNGWDAWDHIRNDRDSTKPVIPGTSSEAMRNAEHYLYAYANVQENPYLWEPMILSTIGYNTEKFWANVGEYYGLWNSPWTYSIPTTDELKAGIEGADDAL